MVKENQIVIVSSVRVTGITVTNKHHLREILLMNMGMLHNVIFVKVLTTMHQNVLTNLGRAEKVITVPILIVGNLAHRPYD